MNQELVDYIKTERARGVDEASIRGALISSGWHEAEVDTALSQGEQTTTPAHASVNKETEVTALPEGSTLIGRALSIFQKRFFLYAGIVIIPVVLSLAFEIPFLSAIIFSLPSEATFVLYIALFLIQFWAYTALIFAIKGGDHEMDVITAYSQSFKKAHSCAWVLLLGGFIMVGGYGLFFIPGIIFSVWFSLSLYVLLDENEKGMNALLKSREYVRGRWWGVAWRLFFGLMLGIIPYAIVAFAVIALTPGIPSAEELVAALVTILWLPFYSIYSYLIYRGLRDEKGALTIAPTLGKKIFLLVLGFLGSIMIPLIPLLYWWLSLPLF